MAEVERRSKPRKVEPKDDEETTPKGHGIVLLAYLVGAVGVIQVMFIVASFLSQGSASNMQLYWLGGTAVVAGGLYALGRWMGREQ